MSKLHLDLDVCLGYANCVVEAPDVFDLDPDSGLAVVLTDDIDAHLEDVKAAVRACPADALRLED